LGHPGKSSPLPRLPEYSVFLGPVLGSESIPFQPAQPISPRPPNSLPVLLSDYILVRKFAPYHIFSLYTPSSIYWYTRGINPRALLSPIIGISPLLPGLIYNIDPLQYAGMNRGILEFYTLSWLDGLVISGLTYYLLFLVWPFEVRTDEVDRGVVLEGEVLDGRSGTDSVECGSIKGLDVRKEAVLWGRRRCSW
jgi:hypothetical protein